MEMPIIPLHYYFDSMSEEPKSATWAKIIREMLFCEDIVFDVKRNPDVFEEATIMVKPSDLEKAKSLIESLKK